MNPYFYNRPSIETINNQIQELERMRNQMQQPVQTPTNLTQNFQIAPTSNESIKYVNSIEDVEKVFVIGDTPYFSKDLSVVWIKNAKGDIKSYELKEIIQKDEKDLMIEKLSKEVDKLKREMSLNEQSIYTNVDEQLTSKKSTISKSNSKSNKQQEWSNAVLSSTNER